VLNVNGGIKGKHMGWEAVEMIIEGDKRKVMNWVFGWAVRK